MWRSHFHSLFVALASCSGSFHSDKNALWVPDMAGTLNEMARAEQTTVIRAVSLKRKSGVVIHAELTQILEAKATMLDVHA